MEEEFYPGRNDALWAALEFMAARWPDSTGDQ
jgi:hypothetical protein